MTYFVNEGHRYAIAPTGALNICDRLPANLYVLNYSPMEGGFKLAPIERFKPLTKYYGNLLEKRDRIISTFESRPAGTGVLLEGEKGSGKTLLGQAVALEGIRRDMPAILINQPFAGDGFNQLIKSIDQPCIVLFDEFEKVYDENSQQALLTLLDGNFPSKKLFLLTINERTKVSTLMNNRPGRVFYRMKFAGLEQSFIIDYCKENLKNQEHIGTMSKITHLVDPINFDMLKAIVEEMNRYNESPQKTLEYLNISPEVMSQYATYSVHIEPKDPLQAVYWLEDSTFRGSPIMMKEGFTIDYFLHPEIGYDGDGELCVKEEASEGTVSEEKNQQSRVAKLLMPLLSTDPRRRDKELKARTPKDDQQKKPDNLGDCVYWEARFRAEDLTKLEDDGTIVFENEDGDVAIFKKQEYKSRSYYDIL